MRTEIPDLNNHINTLHEEDSALSWVANQKINPNELSESSLLKLLTEAIR